LKAPGFTTLAAYEVKTWFLTPLLSQACQLLRRYALDCLDTLLTVMKANHVPVFLVRKFFTQIFCFINVQLFNALLLRRECCSFSNGGGLYTLHAVDP
jgi:hypothetical protein